MGARYVQLSLEERCQIARLHAECPLSTVIPAKAGTHASLREHHDKGTVKP